MDELDRGVIFYLVFCICCVYVGIVLRGIIASRY